MTLLAENFVEVEDHDLIAEFMTAVRDRVVAVYEQANFDLPERRYITVGATAHDCEQLTVSFRQLYLGPPNAPVNEPFRCNTPRTVVLVIEVVRKVALPGRNTPPSVEAIEAKTRAKTADASLLLTAAESALGDDTLVVADVSCTSPQGEYQATVLNMTIGLP